MGHICPAPTCGLQPSPRDPPPRVLVGATGEFFLNYTRDVRQARRPSEATLAICDAHRPPGNSSWGWRGREHGDRRSQEDLGAIVGAVRFTPKSSVS